MLKTGKVKLQWTLRLGKGKKSVHYFKISWDAVNTQATQNKDPFFPPYIIYGPSKNYILVLFPASREKHAYSWSDKYLSGIYLNERDHLQTFPGSQILSWAHRGRIIPSGRFKTSAGHLSPKLGALPWELVNVTRSILREPSVPPHSSPAFLLWDHVIGSVIGKIL